MAFIIGLVLIGLFFLALHYFTDLNHSQKWWVTTIVLALLSIVVMFNEYQNQEADKKREVAMKFNQGKDVKCNDTIINKEIFSLSIGTFTFIGKENTPRAGEMISASDCE
jgi:Na+/melibiose symporter-like transporter